MAESLGADLDQLFPQASQRPRLRRTSAEVRFGDALVIAAVIVVDDEGFDLGIEIAQ
jgi:hypothetical protein